MTPSEPRPSRQRGRNTLAAEVEMLARILNLHFAGAGDLVALVASFPR